MRSESSIQNRVYITLRRYILDLTFTPGMTMSTQDLADRLQVSRTPVREAFIRLERDGLVQIFPQRETSVSLIDMNRVVQERFIRMCLERAALAEFIQNSGGDCFPKLHVLIDKQMAASVDGKPEELLLYDDAFHQLIFEGAGQPLAWELLAQSSTHYWRIRLLSLKHRDISENIVEQHQEILAALESGQHERAMEMELRHLQKLDWEEADVRKRHPDYFVQESKPGYNLKLV